MQPHDLCSSASLTVRSQSAQPPRATQESWAQSAYATLSRLVAGLGHGVFARGQR
jgi:hypothetical protein